MKKNAKIWFIYKIRKYLWIVLPISIIIVFIGLIILWYLYYQKHSEYIISEEKYNKLNTQLKQFNSKKKEILDYTAKKTAYTDYINNTLNYNLIFKTIEHYIPSNTERSSFNIRKKWSDINVSISAEIKWYDDYMSFLRIIDKCSFSSDSEKKSLLNIQKLELSKTKENKDELSDNNALNINFHFNTNKNEYLLLKKYEKKQKEFQDIWKFIYFIDISKDINSYPDRILTDYTETLQEFFDNKKQFTKELSDIIKTDSNGYYLPNTWVNFIKKIEVENQLIDFLIKYLEWYKSTLTKEKSQIYDNWDVIFSKLNSKDKDKVILFNLKDKIDNKIIELNKKILKLTILKRYNQYLQKDNYLSTFDKIIKSPKKYTLVINGEKKELSAQDYISYIINQYNILKEDDNLINESIKKYTTKIDQNKKITIFEKKSVEDIDKEKKKIYTESIQTLKNIDKTKASILDVKTYINNFYKNELNYKLYNEGIIVLKNFVNTFPLDPSFLNNIKYSFFNFKVNNNIKTYKKQFLVTIENNKKLAKKINLLTNNWFLKQLKIFDEFKLKTSDVILALHNNIDCIYKDVKQETKEIYDSILKEKQDENEKKDKIKETDILINSIQTNKNKVSKKTTK